MRTAKKCLGTPLSSRVRVRVLFRGIVVGGNDLRFRQRQLKTKNAKETDTNMIQNPNWRKENQLGIYKPAEGFKLLGTVVKQIHEVLRVGLEPVTYRLEVQHPNHSATMPTVIYKQTYTSFCKIWK